MKVGKRLKLFIDAKEIRLVAEKDKCGQTTLTIPTTAVPSRLTVARRLKVDEGKLKIARLRLAKLRYMWVKDQIGIGGASPVLVTFEREALAELRVHQREVGALQLHLSEK